MSAAGRGALHLRGRIRTRLRWTWPGSLWLATVAADHPLTFLDHRLRVGDSLLGMKVDDLLRPWAPLPTKKQDAHENRLNSVFPLLSVVALARLEELYDGAGEKLRGRFRRAFASLKHIQELADNRPEDLAGHRTAHQTMLGELHPFWDLHCLRLGLAFIDNPDLEVVNVWLKDLGTLGFVTDESRERGAIAWQKGRDLSAFCWDLAFPDVWFEQDGERRKTGGFNVVIGNPPWDDIAANPFEFFAAHSPAILDMRGREAEALQEQLCDSPSVGAAWATHVAYCDHYNMFFNSGGVYPLRSEGRNNLYRLFAERALQISHERAYLGQLLPAGIYLDRWAWALRKHLLMEGDIKVLCGMQNRGEQYFTSVDARLRFAALVYSRGNATQRAMCRFATGRAQDGTGTCRVRRTSTTGFRRLTALRRKSLSSCSRRQPPRHSPSRSSDLQPNLRFFADCMQTKNSHA